MFRIIAIFLLLISLSYLVFINLPHNSNNFLAQLQTFNKTTPPTESVAYSLPNIDQVFSADHRWTATLSAEKKVTIIATGDIIPARSVNFQVLARNDFTWPYLLTNDYVKAADLTFVNLETPLLKNCPTTNAGMVFCGDARNVEGLVLAGVDMVSLGNNHAGNWGKDGVLETVDLLKNNQMTVVGTDENLIAIKEIKGTKFAFLGFNDISSPQPGIADFAEQLVKDKIKEARDQVGDRGVVIVTYHWGVEYRDQPDDRQKYVGHFTIDSGADLVIGNHAHWIQPIEYYKDKLITYAHGNYVFDQMWSEETRLGVIGKYTFFDNQLVDVEYSPLRIFDFGQPRFIEGPEKLQLINKMKDQTLILNKPN